MTRYNLERDGRHSSFVTQAVPSSFVPFHIVGLIALAYIALTLARYGGDPIAICARRHALRSGRGGRHMGL